MKFLDKCEELEEKEDKFIVLVRKGVFFTAIGKSALELNKIFGLKTTCVKTKICKCGIPVNAIKKYLDVLKTKGYNAVVYDYRTMDNEKIKIIEEITRIKGNIKVEEKRLCLNCEECWYYSKKQAKDINLVLEELKAEGSKGNK